MAADERNMPFIKHLASSDRKIRTSALNTLRTFLTSSATARKLTDLDYLKLWKGLFYSVWMCDRPIPQQNLCAELADLLSVLPTPSDDECAVVVPFLRAFWATLSREWTAIDVLRMEKYLLLVRRVFGASLAWVGNGSRSKKDQKWTGARAKGMLKLLEEWPFEKRGDLSKVSVGLRLHVLDIWIDEVEKVELLTEIEGSQSSEGADEFLAGLRRIVGVQSESICKPVRDRANDSLTDERLPWNQVDSSDEMAEDGRDGQHGQDGWGGFDD
ncbi:Nop52-domain-containing protein [Jackrogersella minutella]|nr:Nop52-domain-containing protein [Jackrogersella minutella]